MGEQVAIAPEQLQRRNEWMRVVGELLDQIANWSDQAGWPVQRSEKAITEDGLGCYDVPTLRIRVDSGELHVEPIGLNVVGAAGRVDLEAWPTLNRVKLVRRADAWAVITDSNVPLREPWDR